jgi:hypothetical protein
MQQNVNVNSVEPPLAPQKQMIMITSQTWTNDNHQKAVFMKAKKQPGIPDTLTNLHV